MINLNGKPIEKDLPPLTGSELAALRMESIERRVANLERMRIGESVDDRAHRRLTIGLIVGMAIGAGAVLAATLVAG